MRERDKEIRRERGERGVYIIIRERGRERRGRK